MCHPAEVLSPSTSPPFFPPLYRLFQAGVFRDRIRSVGGFAGKFAKRHLLHFYLNINTHVHARSPIPMSHVVINECECVDLLWRLVPPHGECFWFEFARPELCLNLRLSKGRATKQMQTGKQLKHVPSDSSLLQCPPPGEFPLTTVWQCKFVTPRHFSPAPVWCTSIFR